MLKNDVSVTSFCWRELGTFLERPWDVPPSAINIKNCDGFSILVKNENGDVAFDTWLNLFKGAGDFCDGENST